MRRATASCRCTRCVRSYLIELNFTAPSSAPSLGGECWGGSDQPGIPGKGDADYSRQIQRGKFQSSAAAPLHPHLQVTVAEGGTASATGGSKKAARKQAAALMLQALGRAGGQGHKVEGHLTA